MILNENDIKRTNYKTFQLYNLYFTFRSSENLLFLTYIE